MCGLLAFIAAGSTTGAAAFAEAAFPDAVECLHHRGPDETGLRRCGDDAVFAFKRLSIIDIARSHQPMSYADRYTLVFNGEIYNYRELRAELRASGVDFQTDGDTEVLMAAYHHWGPPAVSRLRGMFAFVLWDAVERCAVAARDRFGIKPLYHALAPAGLYLASEKKALLSLVDSTSGSTVDSTVDLVGLAGYLAMQYVPEPGSLHTGIQRLDAGSTLRYRPGGQPVVERYWRPEFRPRPGAGSGAILGALRDSVHAHLRADVPVGAFLSSGIDSTAIVALAREVKPDLLTFTAALDLPGWSEREVAARTADALGVVNHPVTVDATMMMEALPRIVWHLDDPVADPALVPLWFVAQEAARHVTVVLSGEGADELFAGYPLYREPLSLRPLTRLPDGLRRGLGTLATLIPAGVRGRGLLERASLPIERRHDGGARLFSAADRARLMRSPVPAPEVAAGLYAECAELDDVTRMQYVDLHTWLRGDILVKADRMSMAHSLELRVPFLDPVVFAVAAGLPTRLKLPPRSRRTKHALRQALAGVVPPSTVDRPKLGFPTPVRVWLREEMYGWARDLLATSGAGALLDLSYPAALLEEHRRGGRDHSRRIWAVLVFCLWHAIFIERSLHPAPALTGGSPPPGRRAEPAPDRG